MLRQTDIKWFPFEKWFSFDIICFLSKQQFSKGERYYCLLATLKWFGIDVTNKCMCQTHLTFFLWTSCIVHCTWLIFRTKYRKFVFRPIKTGDKLECFFWRLNDRRWRGSEYQSFLVRDFAHSKLTFLVK